MLGATSRIELQKRWYPALYEQTFGAIQKVLGDRLKDGAVVLDAGCSTGTWVLRPCAGQWKAVGGMDIALPPDPARLPFVLSDLSNTPFRHGTFDLIICYNVIEHLEHPVQVFVEFARLLKPGGALVFKTPSSRSPLVMLSRVTSHRAHRVIKRALSRAAEEEVFPTYYRCNTVERLAQALSRAGLVQETLLMLDQTYEYLAFASWAYSLGLLYSRCIQTGPLNGLGTAIAGVYVKPGSAGRVQRPRLRTVGRSEWAASRGDEVSA